MWPDQAARAARLLGAITLAQQGLPPVEAGDAAGFAAALHRARYYTADPSSYAAGLVSLQREYSHLAIDMSQPARDTLDGLAATQSDALRDLSWALLKESD